MTDSFLSRLSTGSPVATWEKDYMILLTSQQFLTPRVEEADATVRSETSPGGLLDDRLDGHPYRDIVFSK